MAVVRNSQIDSLRGIAIVVIFLMHAFLYSRGPEIIRPVMMLGSFGVQLFLIISGYILCMNNKSYTNFIDKKTFWKKRIIRIIPLFYLFTFINLAIYGLGESKFSIYGNDIWTIGSNFLLVGGFSMHSFNSIIDGSWFIFVIIVCYFIFPFLKNKIRNWSTALAFFVSFRVISLLFSLLAYKFYAPIYISSTEEYIFSIFVYYFFINHISEFILGICLFYIFEKRLFNYDKKFKVLYYLFFLFALYFSGQTNGRFPVNVSNALISILLFLAVSRSPNMVSVNSLLSYFGVRSLSIFLSHLLVIEYTSIYINRLIEHEVLNFLCIVGFSLLITMIISEFTYQLIEKRFSRYLNNKFIGNQIPTSI